MPYVINNEHLTRRKLVTIDGSMVTTETNISIGLNINLPGVKVAGADVRLATLSGTPIARAIECINVPTIDDVMIWYKINTVAGTDLQFWVYWGNTNLTEPASDSTYGSESVWSTDCMAAYLMNNSVSSSIVDYTSNDRDLPYIGSGGALVDTSYGKGIDFSGSMYYRSASDINTGIVDNHTLLAVGDYDTDSNGMLIALRHTSNEYNRILFNRVAAFDNLSIRLTKADGSAYIKDYHGNTNITVDVTRAHGYTWDGTNLNIYVNGVQDTPYNKIIDIAGSMTNTDRKIEIGGTRAATYHDGVISHVMIFNTEKSSNFLLTMHKNINNPSATGGSPFYKSLGIAKHQRRTPNFIG